MKGVGDTSLSYCGYTLLYEKGITYNLLEEKGRKTPRTPIGDYCNYFISNFKMCKSLSINFLGGAVV